MLLLFIISEHMTLTFIKAFPHETIALDVIIVIIRLNTAVIAIIALCIHN